MREVMFEFLCANMMLGFLCAKVMFKVLSMRESDFQGVELFSGFFRRNSEGLGGC
jgi:hypothetical protein